MQVVTMYSEFPYILKSSSKTFKYEVTHLEGSLRIQTIRLLFSALQKQQAK